MREIRQVRQVLPAAATALVFLVLTFTQVLLARPTPPASWRGYLTLLVSSQIDLAEVVARLRSGFPAERIVSARTSTVSVTLVGRREEVVIGSLDERLDPLDPRRDPYMEKLPAMFSAETPRGAMHVLYLRALVPGLLPLRVAALMRGIEGTWSIAGGSPLQGLLSLAAAAAFLAIVARGVGSRRTRLLLALAAVPWLLACFLGEPRDLAVFFLVYPFCAALLAHLRLHWPPPGRISDLRGPLVWTRIAAVCLAVLASVPVIVALEGSAADAARLVLTLGADASLVASFVSWGRLRSSRAEHRVFVPVTIGRRLGALTPNAGLAARLAGRPRGEPRAKRAPGAYVLACLALVCLSPFLFLLGRAGADSGYPAPGPSTGRAGWEGLGTLWITSRADLLPNIADVVAHEAYQTSLAWGGSYGLPSRDGEITVLHHTYREEPPSVTTDVRTPVRYTDRWLRGVLTHARPGSVDALLASQGTSRRVLTVAEPTLTARRPVFWKIGTAFGIVGLLLILGMQYLGVSLGPGAPRTALARRRQLEA